VRAIVPATYAAKPRRFTRTNTRSSGTKRSSAFVARNRRCAAIRVGEIERAQRLRKQQLIAVLRARGKFDRHVVPLPSAAREPGLAQEHAVALGSGHQQSVAITVKGDDVLTLGERDRLQVRRVALVIRRARIECEPGVPGW